MRKLGLWGSGALLVLALGLTAVSAAPPPADDDDGDGPPRVVGPDPAARPRDGWNPIITRVFGLGDKKPAAKADKPGEKDAAKKADAPAPRPSVQAEAAAALRKLEEVKLYRRQDVCRRLREIAQQTNNEDLVEKALALDELAFDVYRKRTALLPQGPSENERADARPSAAARPTGGRVLDLDSESPASVREVKP